MTPPVRRRILGGLAVATLAAALFAPAPEETGEVVAPVAGARDGSPAPAAAPLASGMERVLVILPRDEGEAASVLGVSVAAPQPVAVRKPAHPPVESPLMEPPTPPPDTPPPLRVLGRYQGAGASAVLLQWQQETLVAKVGDTVADAWRLQSMDNDRIVLVHRDTGRRHEVAFEDK